MERSVRTLRADALRRSLFPPTTLPAAIERLGFVQADPIRAPARAQDLILRHRVRGYRADDLERSFESLAIDEEYLYAYGFLSRTYAALLHPRRVHRLSALDRHVLAAAASGGRVHPRDLEGRLRRGRAINAWGGYSNATTRSLMRLQRSGLLRVAARQSGVRLYELPGDRAGALASNARRRGLALLLAAIFAPVPVASLQRVISEAARFLPAGERSTTVVARLVAEGALATATVDGIAYAWPADAPPLPAADDGTVRFLAPFDPVVWDRKRFEHFWGWPYRFEAYVPAPKRKLGYYALPIAWRERMVGWVNVSSGAAGLDVAAGFVTARPRERAFRSAFDDEVERVRSFLRSRR